jgi:Leucine-rich repeat (LRR) protein
MTDENDLVGANAYKIVARWMVENDPSATLDLSGCYLTKLPPLPVNVRRLNISYNYLEEFPEIPASVRHLTCRNNRIRSLECVPEYIEYLDISDNFLTYTPYCLSESTVLIANRNPVLIRDWIPEHRTYIMDMLYSEALVGTLLAGIDA